MIIRYFVQLKNGAHIEINQDAFFQWLHWDKNYIKHTKFINDQPVDFYIKRNDIILAYTREG